MFGHKVKNKRLKKQNSQENAIGCSIVPFARVFEILDINVCKDHMASQDFQGYVKDETQSRTSISCQ